MNIATQIVLKLKLIHKVCKYLIHKNSPPLLYRVLHVEKDNHDNYVAVIQFIGKNKTFHMKPEEILADDKMTDSFSQRDIRTLTYLGYLGINSPKYKILARRLSDIDNKLIFAIQEKGGKNAFIKTADEISTDRTILYGLDQTDAHMVGYTIASEQVQIENLQKKRLLEKAGK